MAPPRAKPNAIGKKVRAIGSCGMTQNTIESELVTTMNPTVSGTSGT